MLPSFSFFFCNVVSINFLTAYFSFFSNSANSRFAFSPLICMARISYKKIYIFIIFYFHVIHIIKILVNRRIVFYILYACARTHIIYLSNHMAIIKCFIQQTVIVLCMKICHMYMVFVYTIINKYFYLVKRVKWICRFFTSKK